MKGLLIKDWKLMKNNALFLVMIIIISIACSAGLENPFFAMGYATALISIFSVNTMAYDEYDNGMAHLFTLPISKKMYVKEKYAFAILLSVAGITISTIIAVVVSICTKEQYGINDWVGILSLSMFLVIVIQGVILPVRMKFDAEKHKMVILIAFGLIALIVGAVFALAEGVGIDVEAVLDGILITKAWVTMVSVLVIGIIVMFVSYRLSVSFMEKREF